MVASAVQILSLVVVSPSKKKKFVCFLPHGILIFVLEKCPSLWHWEDFEGGRCAAPRFGGSPGMLHSPRCKNKSVKKPKTSWFYQEISAFTGVLVPGTPSRAGDRIAFSILCGSIASSYPKKVRVPLKATSPSPANAIPGKQLGVPLLCLWDHFPGSLSLFPGSLCSQERHLVRVCCSLR